MVHGARDVVSVEKDVLTRLIAAARVAGPVGWIQAEAEAEHDVAGLWGAPRQNERSQVAVSTEVLRQLAAAAAASVAAASSAHTATATHAEAEADWVNQVAGDLLNLQRLTIVAGA